jgi:hypothetical protein
MVAVGFPIMGFKRQNAERPAGCRWVQRSAVSSIGGREERPLDEPSSLIPRVVRLELSLGRFQCPETIPTGRSCPEEILNPMKSIKIDQFLLIIIFATSFQSILDCEHFFVARDASFQVRDHAFASLVLEVIAEKSEDPLVHAIASKGISTAPRHPGDRRRDRSLLRQSGGVVVTLPIVSSVVRHHRNIP